MFLEKQCYIFIILLTGIKPIIRGTLHVPSIINTRTLGKNLRQSLKSNSYEKTISFYNLFIFVWGEHGDGSMGFRPIGKHTFSRG